MLLAALRRLTLLLLLSAGLTAAGALLLGALIGASLDRALAVGFYGVGSFLMLSGFFVGNRGPARVKSESPGPIMLPLPGFGPRQMRWATLNEQEETINHSALFVTLGFLLVVIGVLVDSRQSLV